MMGFHGNPHLLPHPHVLCSAQPSLSRGVISSFLQMGVYKIREFVMKMGRTYERHKITWEKMAVTWEGCTAAPTPNAPLRYSARSHGVGTLQPLLLSRITQRGVNPQLGPQGPRAARWQCQAARLLYCKLIFRSFELQLLPFCSLK